MPEETLLSELCSIWQFSHISPPKYRCPRCSVRTCSLPCARKHKTWSQCSGVRDPAAYRTRAQLQDPASFDRDFNFITGIERGLERAEREADRRGIQLDHEYMLDPTTTSNSRNKRKRGGGGGDAASLLVKGELAFVRAAEAAGVMLVRAPRGLTRRKLNRSRVHPKHKCLNWSVEWILASTGQSLIRPCLENTALRDAYDRVLPRPKDDTASATTTTAAGATASEERSLSHRNVYFYLHRQRTPASHRRTVLAGPLSPTATLREVLRGRSVVEFPTVYVLQDDALKEGGDRGDARFVLEEVYLRENPGEVDGVDGEEEEDYTSSGGTSSDEASDDDDDDDEEEAEDEVMQQSRSDG